MVIRKPKPVQDGSPRGDKRNFTIEIGHPASPEVKELELDS